MNDDQRQKASQSMDAAKSPSPSSKDFGNFDYMRKRVDKLIESWKSYVNETVNKNRAFRYIKMDKETLKMYGFFKEDEVYTPVRLIDQNIRSEQPQYIAYITQSRRACVLQSAAGLSITGIEKVEKLFTDHARYEAWETPFIRVVDGQSTHGWDWQEIEFNTEYPGHFCFHHVGHGKLLFDFDTEDIQNQEYLAKEENWTAMQLSDPDEGFVSDQVNKILESNKDSDADQLRDTTHKIYKVYYKKNKIVYVGWYGGSTTDKWLKEPVEFYLGRNDVDADPIQREDVELIEGQEPVVDFPQLRESAYPFYGLKYIESEDPKITNVKGRAFLDQPAQEASGAILSAIVNGTVRASNVYGAPTNTSGLKDGSTPQMKQTTMVLKHGALYSEPITFFHTEYPPASAISSLQTVTSSNKAETSRVDVAAQNRKDSRKTAEEIKSTDQTAAMLSSVQVTNLSIFMRGSYGRAFSIWSNRVLQNKIPADPAIINILKAYKLIVKSSGDVDVIERQAKLQRQQQSWPVFANIPGLNMEFLKDIIRTAFPEDAERYIGIIDKQDQTKALIQGLAGALREAVLEDNGQVKPEYAEFAPQLLELQNQVTNYLSGGGLPNQQGQAQEGGSSNESTAGNNPEAASGY